LDRGNTGGGNGWGGAIILSSSTFADAMGLISSFKHS